MGPLRVDLFATRLNNQLAQYVSWKPDPFEGYPFPPFSLEARCLRKVKQDRGPGPPWFASLLESLVDLLFLLQPYRSGNHTLYY